jgi:hypothetical protein
MPKPLSGTAARFGLTSSQACALADDQRIETVGTLIGN